ncbi:mechanosensitive ion channel family protein [Sulfurisphaera tokodaii]|uniref:Uncharacterized protein n=2 Tax=Sulfurisphaera tokodaii TaxID=111955 RepID=Q96YK9_SULTO|nr:hypothetical protein [Sulfurisphaera tokodaii]BAB67268.1 hypothetical protein STK_21630 [Sulfurisphaera tokodaii str. 7]HII72998.1 hypothetical protein [Sulfurisphaera tokodaii]
MLIVDETISQALTSLATEIISAIPSIILFLIIVFIGYVVAEIVSTVIHRILVRLFSHSTIQISAGLVAGTVKALIILISLSIGLTVVSLGPASVYVSAVARYLPYLAGAILLLTLGITLVNILIDYMGRQMVVNDPFMSTIFNVLKFGLYAIIITLAATLAIFYWVPFISPYLFYDIIIGSIVLLFSFTIIDKAIDSISKSDPNATYITTYGRFLLYTIFLVIAIAIIVQPFSSVLSILQTLAWGLAIAFAILLIPLIYSLIKRMATELK